MIRALLFNLVAAGAALAANAAPPDTHTLQVRYMMGTLFTVEVDGPHAFDAAEAAFAEIARLDRTLSIYRPDSELSRVNAEAGNEDGTLVSADTAGLVARALGYARESHGAFDPTVGPLVALWGFKDQRYRWPSDQEIEEARTRVGYQYADADVDARRVWLGVPGMVFDPGAIGKGFAVQRAVTLLRKRGMTRVRVDAGGNQGVWAQKPERWWFAVKDPRHDGELLGAIATNAGGIATSSGAERGFVHDGKRYDHHIDPHTGRPVEGMLAVTVVAPDAEQADALGTTLYVLGPTAGRRLIAHHPGCAALFVQPGAKPGQPKYTTTPGLDWRPGPRPQR